MMETTELQQAFASLETYDLGSSRADLLAIEDAIRDAAPMPARLRELEERLVGALRTARSAVAREFILNKLAWIAGGDAADTIGGFLDDAQLATSARNALEAIPSPASSGVLRELLSNLRGDVLLGAIDSLGVRRDPDSVPVLRDLLEDSNERVVRAAAYALGRTGTAAAGRALLKRIGQRNGVERGAAAHAGLECAERLATGSNRALARRLWRAMTKSDLPAAVQDAARRRLADAPP